MEKKKTIRSPQIAKSCTQFNNSCSQFNIVFGLRHPISGSVSLSHAAPPKPLLNGKHTVLLPPHTGQHLNVSLFLPHPSLRLVQKHYKEYESLPDIKSDV